MPEIAARPFPFPWQPGRLALVVIDMQRDFIEPGGFGASLGNDMTRLQPAIPVIAANPVFGLDFAAVSEIHARILQVRAKGGAVLLVSEDLDELLELADRIAVMSEGRIVHETLAAGADRRAIGAHMGGGHGAAAA